MTTTTAKERPILFSGPMVRAILDGRKAQTRRVVNPQSLVGHYGGGVVTKCPYGGAGDRLWVRETFQEVDDSDEDKVRKGPIYRADADDLGPWTPSIYMPRKYSRITLEVTGVRVQRVQDISEEDASAEGIRKVTKDGDVKKYCVYDRGDMSSTPWAEMPRTARDAYRILWNSINEKRGFGWSTNPWCWVVEFKRAL
jgi:hypothetical protein